MKKYLLIGGGVVAAIAIGWSALWYLGKGEVEQRVAFEVAQLESRGWTVVHTEQTIGGFPSGYEMELKDVAATRVENGLLVQLPTLRITADASAPTRLTFTLPDEFSAEIPIPEERRAADPRLPRILKMGGTAQDLVIVAEGLSPADRSMTAVASKLDLIVDQEDFASRVLLTLSGLDTGYMPRGEKLVGRLLADGIEIDIANTPEGDAPSAAKLSYTTVSLTANGAVDAWSKLYEIVYGGETGGIDGAFQTGRVDGTLTTGTPDDAERATLTYAAATSTGIYELTSGGVDVQAESRDNAWALTSNAEASPFAGAVTVKGLQARYRMPMAPAEAPAEMSVRLAVEDLEADTATWDQFDPAGELRRGPANLSINLGGTVRVTKRFDELRPGEAPPFEVGNLIVNEIAFSALGASARVAGDIEMLQPINQPLGTLKVTLKGPKGLIETMDKAGILPPELVSMGDAMLQVYANPSDGDDAWQSDVTFGEDGMTINGVPFQ